MSDLFMTVQDLSTGRKFYEIYIRREYSETLPTQVQTNKNDTTPAQNLTGLGSFCLVSREELPDNIGNMVYFNDIDRDGMVDMFYVNP